MTVSEPSSVLFIVREIKGCCLVGIFFVPDDGSALAHAIDQLMDPGTCEYAILSQMDLLFDNGAEFPSVNASDRYGHILWFGDLVSDAADDLTWQRVIDGWVYFVRMGDQIKIGHARDVEKRLKAIRTGCPDKMEIVWVCPGGRRQEQRYHERFRKQHERNEWFRYEGALKEFLEEQLK